MEKTLDSVLIDAIEKTQAGIGEAVDFSLGQAPEIIEQLLMWHAVESLIVCSLGVAILLACAYAALRLHRFAVRVKDAEVYGAMVVPASVAIGGCALINLTWLKIWLAPKLYLLEYAASLVK